LEHHGVDCYNHSLDERMIRSPYRFRRDFAAIPVRQ
jgi:hypothetical protein